MSLPHRRNQTRHVFYDLVNEQRCCETCVWALWRWEGGRVGGVGVRCLIGIHLCVHPPPTSTPTPLCGGALPGEQCWTDRNLCPHFQKFSLVLRTRAWKGQRLSTCTCTCTAASQLKSFIAPEWHNSNKARLRPSDLHQQRVAGLCQWEGLPYLQPSYRRADL